MTDEPIFRTLDEIEPQEIEWLWEPLIPYNKITILEGDPELGKSYLSMHLAALVTTGGKLPDGTKVSRGNALYITSEDDNADTVRPRMEAMGANLKRVRVLADYLVLGEEGQKLLEREMEEFPPDFVVIDTFYSFVSEKVDLGKPTSVRAQLHALDRLFKKFGPAVIIIRHWTKGGKGKAMYRGVGSIDIIGVVRTAMVVAKHPENEAFRVLAQVKNNIGPKAKSFAFELVSREKELPVIEWRGTTRFTADDLEQGNENDSEEERAISFLKKVLATGPLTSKDLFAKAQAANLSRPTINRAKKEAGARSVKDGNIWVWTLIKV